MKVSLLRGALIAGAFLLSVGFASVASAQRQPGGGAGGFGGGGGNNPLTLANNGQVQKELELTEEQIGKLKTLSDEARQAGGGMGFGGGGMNLTQEERDKRREEAATRTAEQTKKVDEILQPQQRIRLKQIVLQLRGTQALSDKETADALGLSDEQKEKLKKAADESTAKMRELFGGGGAGGGGRPAGGAGGQEMRTKMEEARTAAKEAALAVLSAEQKERFEKMQGKAFKLEVTPRTGGRGGAAKNANPAPEKKDL